MTQRTCGECAACCTAVPVVPLGKLAGQRCRFHAGGDTPAEGHCSDYANRPRCCVVYACEWMRGFGTDDQRPDQWGVIVEALRDDRGRMVVVVLIPAPGFTEQDPTFCAAVDDFCAQQAVVTTPTTVYATPQQLQSLRNTKIMFADRSSVPAVDGMIGGRQPTP